MSTQWYSSQYAPSSYQIQTSPDGATWTTQATVTSDTAPSNNPGPVYNHVLPTPVTTNYLRLVATAFNPAGTDPFAHVALLEMGWDGHGVTFPVASSPNTTFAYDAPANAIDANPATFWQPVAATTTPTVQVNLGAPTSVSTVSTQWYSSEYAPSSYQIQTSPDGATWTTQATVTTDTAPSNNPGPVYNHVLPTPVTTNYLRLVATAFNPPGTDPFAHVALLEMGWDGHGVTFPVASSPNTTFASDAPANAIDANPATFWQPVAATTTPTVQVNLGAPTSVSTVSTQWYSSQYAPSSYQIQTSPDGATWTTQATVTSDTAPSNNPGPVYNHVLPTPVTTNYLRLVATAFNPAGTDPFAHVALLEMGWS